MKIDHVAIVVKDIEKAKSFFVELGFELKNQNRLEGEWIDKLTGLKNVNAEFAALGFDGRETNLELLCFNNPKGETDDLISKPNQVGFRHMAIAVDGIEKYFDKLKKNGATILSDIQNYGTGKKLFYFLGPEGVVLEMAEYIK